MQTALRKAAFQRSDAHHNIEPECVFELHGQWIHAVPKHGIG